MGVHLCYLPVFTVCVRFLLWQESVGKDSSGAGETGVKVGSRKADDGVKQLTGEEATGKLSYYTIPGRGRGGTTCVKELCLLSLRLISQNWW